MENPARTVKYLQKKLGLSKEKAKELHLKLLLAQESPYFNQNTTIKDFVRIVLNLKAG